MQLLAQFHQGSPLSAFVLGGFLLSGYMGVGFQEFADGAAEDAGAVAVDDADAGQAG